MCRERFVYIFLNINQFGYLCDKSVLFQLNLWVWSFCWNWSFFANAFTVNKCSSIDLETRPIGLVGTWSVRVVWVYMYEMEYPHVRVQEISTANVGDPSNMSLNVQTLNMRWLPNRVIVGENTLYSVNDKQEVQTPDCAMRCLTC